MLEAGHWLIEYSLPMLVAPLQVEWSEESWELADYHHYGAQGLQAPAHPHGFP